jgi:hypothetical protein
MKIEKEKTGFRIYEMQISDPQLIKAAIRWQVDVEHQDAPTLKELLLFREILGEISGQETEMVCTNWLRNKFVQLRKAGLLKGE